jgi:hypothetical protein
MIRRAPCTCPKIFSTAAAAHLRHNKALRKTCSQIIYQPMVAMQPAGLRLLTQGLLQKVMCMKC